ncbi:5,6-dimethylbenzimidazole synthase [Simiduia sp. 21SJ11W-1]|uniref:5,6-dimethylbenzimidazole synthase n=1 Tax=Simiduia sp. 21SJ11W-1 TaxID=2909669 RepID=UPI00209F02D8|nr:5,6-dimethylbenzimidazole synthase [Simiduia sp. 21SJ11W-1]UTA46705.1 5,6-dimethylbenzimidazole synthase [Simiduia sp. 21SJ11W-1]
MDNQSFNADHQQALFDIMRHRRDVRGNNFTSTPIPQDVINTILEAATLAPSVGFSQPWEFVMVTDPHIKTQIRDSFNKANAQGQAQFLDAKQEQYKQLKLEGIMEAPVNIAVFYKPSSKPVLGQNTMKEMGEYSVVCAIQNMWLSARSLNVGMGWVSILCPHTVKRLLKAPEECKLVGYLCLGYVKTFYDSPELERLRWEKRKHLEQAVHTNAFPTAD